MKMQRHIFIYLYGGSWSLKVKQTYGVRGDSLEIEPIEIPFIASCSLWRGSYNV